ncbi:MAG TPA: thiol:disulfide interchange protein DsbA/DsbL [Burkholderiales bacterium]|nr:thiol:disulfide interchange protein DsbA/DsbL [Burkholderiales bacterium]
MSLFARLPRLAAAFLCLALATAFAYAQAPGKDFKPINPPQPTPPGKVEVIEFFSYACPHCHSLAGPLSEWLKRKPADVEFKRVPAVFNDTWLQYARIYYTLEALGLVDKLHHDVFAAIHKQKMRLNDPKVFEDWAASKGVDRKKVADTYNSFAVKSLTQRAVELTKRYGIDFTPSMVVDGRYITGPSMTSTGNEVDYGRFFKVVEQMVANARRPGAGKK